MKRKSDTSGSCANAKAAKKSDNEQKNDKDLHGAGEAFALTLVTLVPTLNLSTRVAFGHLGIQRGINNMFICKLYNIVEIFNVHTKSKSDPCTSMLFSSSSYRTNIKFCSTWLLFIYYFISSHRGRHLWMD